MSKIRFPGFGIETNITNVAFCFCGIDVYFYAICIVLGILISIILSGISKEKFGINHDFLIKSIFGMLIFGIVGARFYYILFNLKKYLNEPLEIFNLRNGGLAFYGGMIFVSIYLFYRCKKQKVNFLDFLDYIVPFVAIAQSIGRWGNFFNREAYGYETNNIFRMGMTNSFGNYIEVHPTFLYESFLTFLIFIFLRFLQKRRKFKGEVCYSYIICYSFIRIFIEGLRQDSLMLFNLRISQILSVIFFVLFFVILFQKNKITR